MAFQLRKDAKFTNPTGNQLVVLATVVEDDDFLHLLLICGCQSRTPSLMLQKLDYIYFTKKNALLHFYFWW